MKKQIVPGLEIVLLYCRDCLKCGLVFDGTAQKLRWSLIRYIPFQACLVKSEELDHLVTRIIQVLFGWLFPE